MEISIDDIDDLREEASPIGPIPLERKPKPDDERD